MTARSIPSEYLSSNRVHLPNAPLERVLCQVRFPTYLPIREEETVVPLQKAIRDQYPTMRAHEQREVDINAQQVRTKGGRLWRFTNPDSTYRATLAPGFFAIDTPKYDKRESFLTRIRDFAGALGETIGIAESDRIGVRYISRLQGENLARLRDLVKPEYWGADEEVMDSFVLLAGIGELQLRKGDLRVQAKYGQLPAKVTVDPDLISPSDQPAWILDIDAHRQVTERYDPDNVLAIAAEAAKRQYDLFRMIVTDEFLRQFGGEV